MNPLVSLPQELIRIKRDGGVLHPEDIEHFVRGVTDESWSEGQVAAMAMAIFLRGMDTEETVALTQSMVRSGEVLHWGDAGLQGPTVDKHSTGGVGDKVSLMLAPILAACGAVVPMISGRGLGHTGGTLDKLESLPGYQSMPDVQILRQVLRATGCAIVGATSQLAPADRRLYAVRDITATVESVPLITASILSKKLAAGLQGLVMDVKVGNGAVSPQREQARMLARSLVQVARGAGLPTVAILTDMNQVLGTTAGNAVEVQEAIDFLSGHAREPRLLEVTLALSAQALLMVGLAPTLDQARTRALSSLDSGAAAERFARMVAALGGPRDVLGLAHRRRLFQPAPVQLAVRVRQEGYLRAINTRAAGWIIATLGGGRRHAGDRIDPRVGVTQVAHLGTRVEAGDTVAVVHATDEDHAQAAAQAWLRALDIAPIAPTQLPVVVETIEE